MSTTRPTEIEPLSNRFLIHPLGDALLPLAIRLRLHPTAVTSMGLVFGLLAGLAYAHWPDWRFATLGLLMMVGWHVMDGLDGKLARATGRTSDLGRLLDGVADYTAFVAVYVALALTSDNPKLALGLAVVSGACHALQSLFYEGERATYIRRLAGQFAAAPRSQVGGLVEWLYNRGEFLLGNRTRPFDTRLSASDDNCRSHCLAIWQPRAARIFRWMTPLSANGRTIAIWVAVMAHEPMLFWLWEILPLSLYALLAAHGLRHAEAVAGRLATPATKTPGNRGPMNGHA